MPLLGKYLYIEKRDKNGEFVVQSTKEHFNSLLECERRITFYGKHIWTSRGCPDRTMPYIDALAIERDLRDQALKAIPSEVFQRFILTHVHMSRLRLSQLLPEFSTIFASRCLIGERVAVRNGKRKNPPSGVVTNVHEVKNANESEYFHEVQLDGEELRVSNLKRIDLQRRDRCPTQASIKLFLQATAYRFGLNIGSLWFVIDEEMQRKFGIVCDLLVPVCKANPPGNDVNESFKEVLRVTVRAFALFSEDLSLADNPECYRPYLGGEHGQRTLSQYFSGYTKIATKLESSDSLKILFNADSIGNFPEIRELSCSVRIS
ncbi:hypothetical protein ACOME3_001813 [Neoechinorhynchus agilis]